LEDYILSFWVWAYLQVQTLLFWLVVSTHLKNISQNGIISPSRSENKKYLKPPPSFWSDAFPDFNLQLIIFSDSLKGIPVARC